MSIVRQGFANSLYDMPLHIVWRPTFHCNYKCSYCVQPENRPKGEDWLSEKNINKLFDNLLYLNRSKYTISITGGEATVYPYLIPALTHIVNTYNEKLNRIYMFSNGSKNENIYENIFKLSEKISMGLFISIHTDHAEIEQIKYLVTNLSVMTDLNFVLMFNPAKHEKTYKIFNTLLELRESYAFNLTIQTIRDLRNGGTIDSRYTKDDFEWQKDSIRKFNYVKKYSDKQFDSKPSIPNQLINNTVTDGVYRYEQILNRDQAMKDGTFNHHGKFCVLGTHHISINPDGRALNAVCEQATCSKDPVYINNPYDCPGFCKIIQCNQELCGCGANDHLQKFLIYDEAKDFMDYFTKKRKCLEADYVEIHNKDCILKNQKQLLKMLNKYTLPFESFIDREYYFAKYPDVAASGMSAAEHYQKYGWLENRDPNNWFNTAFYLSQFDGNSQPGINPLAHFILYGCSEGKKPNAEGIAIS